MGDHPERGIHALLLQNSTMGNEMIIDGGAVEVETKTAGGFN